uniref:Major facilitator superfamily (MFS) profile domain-containing protein n=1 Tax=Rhodnius prolixus TaxID=13249 RepID=T1HCZ8_RHOPR
MSKIKIIQTIELVGPSYRTMVTILTNIAYSLGLVALAVIAYLVRDWRQLALATSVPFLTFFLYWWVLPESPRWLLARGRFDEAEKILNTMARVNGRSLPPNYIVDLKRKYQVDRYMKEKEFEKGQTKERTYGVADLFRTPNLRRKTVIITFIWFTNTSVYVGLSYYASVLSGDEFLNFLLAGAVELPTYLVLWPGMQRIGRRWTVCISMLIGGGACLATVLCQQGTGSLEDYLGLPFNILMELENDTTTLILYCIGKMGISSSYVVLPLMASELYPTVVRGLGMSTSSVAGMLGPVFIPIVNYMCNCVLGNKQQVVFHRTPVFLGIVVGFCIFGPFPQVYKGADHLVLPLVIMGSLLVAGGGCSLLLPETLHQHLPQTLEDGENFGQNSITCCPPRVSDVSPKKQTNMAESPIKSLLHVSLRDTPASTPIATDITSSTDVTSDTVFSLQEHTLRVTVV